MYSGCAGMVIDSSAGIYQHPTSVQVYCKVIKKVIACRNISKLINQLLENSLKPTLFTFCANCFNL